MRHADMLHSKAVAEDRRSTPTIALDPTTSTTLHSSTHRGPRPFIEATAITPAEPFHPPALVRSSRAASHTPALRRNMTPSTLLSDVLEDPFFQLLGPLDDVPRSVPSRGSSLRSSVGFIGTELASMSPRSLSRTSVNLPAAAAAEATAPSSPRTYASDYPLALPSSAIAPPSMLLAALADMDVLQQSFYAHTSVWPAREQIAEFKKLVAASMKAELTHEGTGSSSTATADAVKAAESTSAATPAAAAGEKGDAESAVAAAAARSAGARQAHDAAVRAALHGAHGFLHGPESVPNGVPKAHLQRARKTWVQQYKTLHVQPRLAQAQRHRYELHRMQQRQQQQQQQKRNATRMSRGLSISFPAAPANTCVSLRPHYWREDSVDQSAGADAGGAAAAEQAVVSPSKRVGRLRDAVEKRYGYVPSSGSVSAGREAGAIDSGGNPQEQSDVAAVWEVDLFDDLHLVVTTELTQTSSEQISSRGAIEPAAQTAQNPLGASSSSSTAAATLLRQPPSNLTQMQLPLPAFVYVMSRYLFAAHYAPHFPPGLFSPALLNPFYFPEPAQCTAPYALRATPALQREASAVRAAYATQLADAHNCYPERVAYLEIPLPRNDILHIWELLCPPQRPDRVGRWLPVPWGQLLPDEEDTLLEQEYGEELRSRESMQSLGSTASTEERPLLAFAYARAARLLYRERLQRLAQHPIMIAEVQRLLAVCEEVAHRFFSSVDTDQRGCIFWEDFTTALIEEADIQDHQLKVREHAAQLTRASASVFDRYVVEPLTPALVRLGYTGTVFEVRHSASLVMVEGAADYAVCDGTQLGSIHQRFLVRPVEVVLKEMEAVPRDAFGRPLRLTGFGPDGDDADDLTNSSGGGGNKGKGSSGGDGGGASGGYDAALRRHPWRNNQQPVRAFTRYEDGRRLQESTALSVLQQLSGGAGDVAGGDDDRRDAEGSNGEGGSGGRKGGGADGASSSSAPVRMHQPAKPVTLQSALAVEDVTPYVPWTVFVVLSNDMLLRLYSSSKAVQALPEAGLLRCAETVTCMEWAAGGSHGRGRMVAAAAAAAAANNTATATTTTSATSDADEHRAGSGGSGSAAATATSSASRSRPPRAVSRLSVQKQEYILLGTRSGVLCLVDLYAILHKVPRLMISPGTTSSTAATAQSDGGDAGKSGAALLASAAAEASGAAAAGGGISITNAGGGGGGAAGGAGRPTSERIGSSSSAWSGYRALAQRTYYNDIDPFVLHRRQVHTPGTVVASVVAAASNGLFVSSGLDGDVFTMRLGFPSGTEAPAASGASRAAAPRGAGSRAHVNAARAAMTTVHSDGTTTTTAERPMVCIEVLQRLTVGEMGVRYALPIPSLSLLAVQTVTNKVFLYHTSILPGAATLAEGGRGGPSGAAGSMTSRAEDAPQQLLLPPSSQASAASRIELYDAASPHLGSMVAVMAVEELDQLLTVDSTAYVKVWSLRQTQPLTSFYALAPVQGANAYDALVAQGGAGDGRSGGANGDGVRGGVTRPSSTPGSGSGGGGGGGTSNSVDGKGVSSSLLRTTKHSIEAAVDASESRLQPCLSAAYNYAGRQLYIMGSNNAALCFFMSGQSSARAHTNPLRVLLVDTAAARSRGQPHRRLITLSIADCRVWSLLTGAMELGIRASNAEYRQLFDHRITGRPGSGARKGETERGEESGQHRGAGRQGRAALSASAPSLSAVASLTAAASTTGETSRLLPPSVEDVMRAVATRPSAANSSRRRARNLRVNAMSSLARGVPSASATATQAGSASARHAGVATPRAVAGAGGVASSPLAAVASTSRGATAGTVLATGEGDEADPLLPRSVRDQNVVTSDIRCACLGPEGQWVAYALQHGEVRLHRTDSGRLLHTFVTTPPSVTELLQAALHYEHLFAATSGTSFGAAAAGGGGASASVGGGSSSIPASTPRAPVKSQQPQPPQSPSMRGAARHPQSPPKAKVTPASYAQAVAVVLQRLLASVKAGQRFGSFTGASRSAAAASALSGGAGGALDGGDRDVHREPLTMFYVEAAQELFVVYADGLVRVFTLVGHRTTATRIIISRTLVNRALDHVRRAMQKPPAPSRLPPPSPSSPAGGVSNASGDAQLRPTRPASPAHAGSALHDSHGAATAAGGAKVSNLESATRATGGDTGDGASSIVATGPPSALGVAASTATAHKRRASSLLADASGMSDAAPRRAVAAPTSPTAAVGASRRLLSPSASASASAAARPLEPDVVLLATASPPLGLVCLVHASGLITVMDVQATGDDTLAGLGSRAGDGADDFGKSLTDNATGLGSAGDVSRSQAGIVVHSFVTQDEVTAAAFLGAYPCLVLADQQRLLSFHLMRGSGMLAMMGDFVEKMQKDARAGLSMLSSASAVPSPTGSPSSTGTTSRTGATWPGNNSSSGGAAAAITASGVSSASPSATSSSTLMWTVSVDATCASEHALGSVTVLTFDPLYATLYVGTSQGYVVSYLVRRLLLAFQLSPVFLRGVDGVAVTTYAAELRRGGTRRPSGAAAALAASPSSASGLPPYAANLLRVLFDVDPSASASASPAEADKSVQASGVGAAPVHQHPQQQAWSRALDSSSSPLLRFYEAHPEEFSWSHEEAAAHTKLAPALFAALARSPASTLYTAAAVLHDAVTRMQTAATVRVDSASGTGSTLPWWDGVVGGALVREFVTRQCGAGPKLGFHGESVGVNDGDAAAAAAKASGALPDAELKLDKEALQLLRDWVLTAVTAPQGHGEAVETSQSPYAAGAAINDGAAAAAAVVAPHNGGLDSLATSGTVATLPPPSLPPTPVKPASTTATNAPAAGATHHTIGTPPSMPSLTSASPGAIADALVREVEDELLFGETAAAFQESRAANGTTPTGDGAVAAASVARPVHPITEAWVEPLFTRHAVAMASRSPLCLLTPPAMLERSRRERLDRQAKRGTAARRRGVAGKKSEASVAASAAAWEWDRYVEGAPPDYLADMLSRPGQVLPEAERQALRQRAITALQCRCNGYLCVGHADGSVSLWTPYACGRVESLCPTTSLPVSLERLSRSVRNHFQFVHERVVLERQRLAFEGSARRGGRGEHEGKAQMKQRIRKMLLSHHLSQLVSQGDEDAVTGSSRGYGNPNLAHRVGNSTAAATPTRMGTLEQELHAMQPLLCLLLGVASPAELQARQLTLEDLCFLPLNMESIAALEAFRPTCYAAAAEVAVKRLWRELIESDDSGSGINKRGQDGGGVTAGAHGGGADEHGGASTLSPRLSLALGRMRMASSAIANHAGSGEVRSVYDYPLSVLAQALHTSFPPSGLAAMPGAVRLLLHRALEGAPHNARGNRSSRSSLARASGAHLTPSALDASPGGTTAATTSASASAVGPAEGGYYEVCHGVQLAEVAAEALWELQELQRLYDKLQRAKDGSQGRLETASAARIPGLRHRGDDTADDVSTPIPPGSAAAVNAAVQRQLEREWEGRLAALAQRTAANAQLRTLQLQATSSSASATNAAASTDSCGGVGYTRLTRGVGLAWVQATLRQQVHCTLAQPLLLLPVQSAKRPPVTTLMPAATTANTFTKLRAAATVNDARRQHRPQLLPPSLAFPLGVSSLSPADAGALSLSASAAPPTPARPPALQQPSVLVGVQHGPTYTPLVTPGQHSVRGDAAQPSAAQQEQPRRDSVSAPTTPLGATVAAGSEHSLCHASVNNATAVFLTEMQLAGGAEEEEGERNADDGDDDANTDARSAVNAFPSPDPFGAVDALEGIDGVSAGATVVTVSAPKAFLASSSSPSPAPPPPAPYLRSAPLQAGCGGCGDASRPLPPMPRHRTKMTRTGSSAQPVRPRAVASAGGVVERYAVVRAASFGGSGSAADAAYLSNVGDAGRASPTRFKSSPASRMKAAQRSSAQGLPYSWCSLLGGSSTTK